jgi:hypothetical protein
MDEIDQLLDSVGVRLASAPELRARGDSRRRRRRASVAAVAAVAVLGAGSWAAVPHGAGHGAGPAASGESTATVRSGHAAPAFLTPAQLPLDDRAHWHRPKPGKRPWVTSVKRATSPAGTPVTGKAGGTSLHVPSPSASHAPPRRAGEPLVTPVMLVTPLCKEADVRGGASGSIVMWTGRGKALAREELWQFTSAGDARLYVKAVAGRSGKCGLTVGDSADGLVNADVTWTGALGKHHTPVLRSLVRHGSTVVLVDVQGVPLPGATG